MLLLSFSTAALFGVGGRPGFALSVAILSVLSLLDFSFFADARHHHRHQVCYWFVCKDAGQNGAEKTKVMLLAVCVHTYPRRSVRCWSSAAGL